VVFGRIESLFILLSDTGGGVALDPYRSWISEVTGLAMVPEPGPVLLFLSGLMSLFIFRMGRLKR
jgi:hypothetical protein